MHSQKNIVETYDKIAANYAAHYMDELDHKPLDRLLLRDFAIENKDKGTILDIGCGPGQTTKFLSDEGCTDIIGTDLSPVMITEAKRINPHLNFEVADALALQYNTNTFAAAVAFYAIVNLDYPIIKTVFTEINRVLKPGAPFLLSFHTGDDIVHVDELLDKKVNIDFYFLDVDSILSLLKEACFTVTDALVRYPYPQEYPSQRAYIKAIKE
jgi:ubiquinone/menaquinone biosynthesis C-methylase UbiE